MMTVGATDLGRWLHTELERRSLSQIDLASQAGIGMGTISGVLKRGHVPKLETLFRLADFFGTPRERVLRLAAELPLEPETPEVDDYLVEQLVAEFRKVPEEWREEAIAQIRLFARLAARPSARLVGEDDLAPKPGLEPDET